MEKQYKILFCDNKWSDEGIPTFEDYVVYCTESEIYSTLFDKIINFYNGDWGGNFEDSLGHQCNLYLEFSDCLVDNSVDWIKNSGIYCSWSTGDGYYWEVVEIKEAENK